MFQKIDRSLKAGVVALSTLSLFPGCTDYDKVPRLQVGALVMSGAEKNLFIAVEGNLSAKIADCRLPNPHGGDAGKMLGRYYVHYELEDFVTKEKVPVLSKSARYQDDKVFYGEWVDPNKADSMSSKTDLQAASKLIGDGKKFLMLN